MLLLHDELVTLYVSNSSKFAHDVEMGGYWENWLGYCILL